MIVLCPQLFHMIDCTYCAYLCFFLVDRAVEAFAEQLDASHKVTCPWKGSSCADSLVQFPPTPQSALIGGYKDRCDGLLQFISLPMIALTAIETMRLTRSSQIDRLLSQPYTFLSGELGYKADSTPGLELSRDDSLYNYSLVCSSITS